MLKKICNIAIGAGEKVMKFYNINNFISHKNDNSPITKADICSNQFIINKLKKITPKIPILTEENIIPWEIRKYWKTYWLIDPLDGTKEFIKKNGEFTINIALIKNFKPVLGVIYAPVLEYLYYANTKNSWKKDIKNKKTKIIQTQKKIPLRILLSHSDQSNNNMLKEYLKLLKENFQVIKIGSSLKFCFIAEGKSQIYMRFHKTNIWDTAAGEIIAKSAGAYVLDIYGNNLNYSPRPSFLNPEFIVSFNKILLKNIFAIKNK